MRLLKFIRTSKIFGDESSTYDVQINKDNTTVKDIIEYILSQNDEWGFIYINNFLSSKRIEYKYGVIISDNIPSEDKNKIVKIMDASGGWSRMDYRIIID